jgi:predicted negative regulator of RcsB-dependent stress response
MTTEFRTLLIAAVALVVAAVLGYWAYGTHKKSGVGKEAMALAQETGRHLQEALSTDPGRPSTETVQAVTEYAAAASRNLETLKRLDAAGNQALVDALDDTLLTSREILGRQAAAYRFRRQLLASTQALRGHMRADNRTGAWVREAVQGKERVEKDYRDYLGAAEALDKLLESFPASLAKLASRSGAAPLVDDKLVAEARKRSTAALQQATDEVEKIRQFAVPR